MESDELKKWFKEKLLAIELMTAEEMEERVVDLTEQEFLIKWEIHVLMRRKEVKGVH